MIARSSLISILLLLLLASPLAAKEWYDHYNAGVDAAKKKNWTAVISNMNAAIAIKPNEEKNARTYGNLFVNYRPYYYRGAANFELGNFQEAIRDLENTGGAGPVNLGSAESLLNKAQTRIASNQPSPPPPVTPRENDPRPTVPTNTVTDHRPPPPNIPGVDPVIARERSRAETLLADARRKQREGQNKKAPSLASSEWAQAQTLLQSAMRAQASAETAAQWKSVADSADRAVRQFNSAILTAESRPADPTPSIAASVLKEREQITDGLRDYFDGNFSQASDRFEKLVAGSGKNYPLLWAFLGASYYYEYYLSGSSDRAMKGKAEQAFRQAKSLDANLKLDNRYFSPRVRNFYSALR
jgi:tetratricopeptide (TPR) repeat protein